MSSDQQVQSTSTLRQALGEDAGSPPGKDFGKKTARTTFSFTPNIRKLIFLVSRAAPFLTQRTRRQTRDENDGKVLAPSFSVVSHNTPFIVPSHLLRTSSYMNFFRIQCNFILYKYTHTYFFSFSLYFYFILFFLYLIFYFIFFVFRDVPECSMFLVLATAIFSSRRLTHIHYGLIEAEWLNFKS